MTNQTTLTDLDIYEAFIDKLDINPYTKNKIKVALLDCWWSGYEECNRSNFRKVL